MKKLLPALLAMMCNVSNAQISITYQDFQAAFLQDAVFVTCSTPPDGTGYEVYIGEASSVAQTWDITALPMDYMALSKVIEPSSAPFSGDFPNSNFVLYEKYWFGKEIPCIHGTTKNCRTTACCFTANLMNMKFCGPGTLRPCSRQYHFRWELPGSVSGIQLITCLKFM